MVNQCVMCGAEMPESGHVCLRCMEKNDWPLFGELIAPPKANTELSFGDDSGSNFLVYYRRAKPLNWFQRWMFKVCFGINARNI